MGLNLFFVNDWDLTIWNEESKSVIEPLIENKIVLPFMEFDVRSEIIHLTNELREVLHRNHQHQQHDEMLDEYLSTFILKRDEASKETAVAFSKIYSVFIIDALNGVTRGPGQLHPQQGEVGEAAPGVDSLARRLVMGKYRHGWIYASRDQLREVLDVGLAEVSRVYEDLWLPLWNVTRIWCTSFCFCVAALYRVFEWKYWRGTFRTRFFKQ